jgi:Ca2+-transporting ATPase
MATTLDAPARRSLPDQAWYTLPPEQVTRGLDVDAERGLAGTEAASRLQQYGPNKFTVAATEPRWRAFVRQYDDPMQIVLLIAGIGSIWPLHELGTGLVVLFLTLFNAVLGLRQEGKAAEAVAALQKMMIIKAKVRRDGGLVELPAEQLVPGDVVQVEAGDVVPADGRVLEAATLEVGESALTGESMPVSKGLESVADPETPLGDRTDMVYMNTNVTRGTGAFVVTATGMSTEVGHISHMLESETDEETPLTKQLTALTGQILVISGVAVAISIALNLSRGETFTTVFTAAIAFAIAAIPTGLPAVVTTILSMGTQLLAQAGAIVKRLRSTETLGSVSGINSDKTGTLTLNQMTAIELTIPGRRYTISGSGYATDGTIKHSAGQPEVPLDPFLLPMVLAADAVVHDGELIGDPTEGALVVLAEKGGLDSVRTRAEYPRVAALPFDTAYKLMATFHRMQDDDGREVVRAFVKGAPDQLLARATIAPRPEDLEPIDIDEAFRKRYMDENERLAEQGLRVLATARKDFDPADFDPTADLLPLMQGLTILALVGIVDPPRPEAKVAIAEAKAAGIRVRMITGDHAVTAQAIARTLGIEGRALTGAEFGALSDDELLAQIDEIGVIARVTPEHKVRLVDTLKRHGEIVAMTGDGVNDAPSLKAAHIGIAMGGRGTDVAREASSIVLLDDDFGSVVKAVRLGRRIYDNLRKAMGFILAVHVPIAGLALLPLISGLPIVLGPIHIAFLEMVIDPVCTLVFEAEDEEDDVMRRPPRPTEEPLLSGRLILWGVLQGLLAFALVASIYVVASVRGMPEDETRALAFFSLVTAIVALVFANRSFSASIPTALRMPNRALKLVLAVVIVTLGLTLVWPFASTLFRFGPLHLDDLSLTVGAGVVVLIALELLKPLLRERVRR